MSSVETAESVGQGKDGGLSTQAPSGPATPGRSRIDSIDLLRGIVMVIMMLDHTRDFVHSGGLLVDPTDLHQTTATLFFTRWITHFCAPAFEEKGRCGLVQICRINQ